ncbi:GP88 family protein [Actinomadura hibisca]|uniref:GP88 family protein n=1 Tax=Actinomadura hibisca TaxID=68565 RepID=UPI0008339CF4|nr:hypothetical protein [Actinomadura hibisca]
MNPAAPSPRPKKLLTSGNRNLRRDGIYSWTIPALSARLPDGSLFRTCPAAHGCASLCYARTGSYMFPAAKTAHLRNLLYVLEDPSGWENAMMAELARPVMEGKKVRLHDAGDFFSDSYTTLWLRIIRANPHVYFYAYTKEVDRYRRLIEPDPPENSGWVLSLGGREDELINFRRDRVADVFPTEADILAAGYHPQTESDLLAVLGPTPVGMTINNHPHLRRKLGLRSFGSLQAELSARRPSRQQ